MLESKCKTLHYYDYYLIMYYSFRKYHTKREEIIHQVTSDVSEMKPECVSLRLNTWDSIDLSSIIMAMTCRFVLLSWSIHWHFSEASSINYTVDVAEFWVLRFGISFCESNCLTVIVTCL